MSKKVWTIDRDELVDALSDARVTPVADGRPLGSVGELADAIARHLYNVSEQEDWQAEAIRNLAEVVRLRQVLWLAYTAAGADTDGEKTAPSPGVLTPDVPEAALAAVRELRQDYDAGPGWIEV
jgi:hypothetical protein